jgi:hypothetical protein
LWNRENQHDRYILVLQKAQGTATLRIRPKGNTSRMKNLPENQIAQKSFVAVPAAKKIVFEDDDE